LLRATLEEQEIRRIIGVPGEGDRVVDGISPLDEDNDRSLYFINKELTPGICESFAGRKDCIVVVQTGSSMKDALGNSLVLEADDPRAELAKVLGFVRDEGRAPPLTTRRSIAPTADISPLAVIEGAVDIADGVVIEPFCMVGPDVRIGRGSVLRSGVRIHPRVVIGEHSLIGSNTVIGQQGFGFVRDESGNKTLIPHLGGVVIGSNVEIGALVSMQSGTIVPTIIEDRAKIGDLVGIGHNVRVARSASLTGGAIIAGHAVIEEEAWVGINSSIRQGCRVGSHALVGMDASIQQDVPDKSVVRAPRPDVQARKDLAPFT
jgi:UDP-3-O-[3-hydroxymyristoyl] glucosamine N-acyltransferase LpxD